MGVDCIMKLQNVRAKAIFLTLFLVLLAGIVPLSTYAKPSSWAEDSIDVLIENNMVPEYLLEEDKYQQPITRQEFTDLAVRLYAKAKGMGIDQLDAYEPFADTDDLMVAKAYSLGIINGVSSTEFAPDNPITRQEIATLLTRELKLLGIDTGVTQQAGFVDMNEVAEWAKEGVNFCTQAGIMNGVGGNRIAPLDNATREEVIVLIARIADKYQWTDDYEAIAFEDPNFEEVIRRTINKRTGDITKKDVRWVNYIFAPKEGIKSLKGIENLENLTELYLNDNEIDDISVLSGLKNLKRLRFNNNKITNIDCLSNLTNLELIEFENNAISDISVLKNLTGLKYVNLNMNEINDISSLANLEEMEQLYLSGNSISDISPLKKMYKLKALELNQNKITDISALEDHTELVYLSLEGNNVSDLGVCSKFMKLEMLDINGNPISDISPIKNIQSLRWFCFLNMDIDKEYNEAKIDLSKYEVLLNKVNSIINEVIKDGMSDLEKEKAIHDYLVLNCRYDYDNFLKGTIPEESYSAYGLLINGAGVCQAYAEATQILLSRAGIECMIVTGSANGVGGWGGHAWNIVKIDGKYYHLDVTWDDPVPDEKGRVLYWYFNLTDEQISNDHTWERSLYPECK